MERESKPNRDYLELILFMTGWLGLFLLLIALLFAHHVGLLNALSVSLGYWFFIIIVFGLILLLNLGYILFKKLHNKHRKG